MKTVRGSLALILLNLAAALPLLAGTPMPDRGKVIEEPCPPDTRAMLSFRTDYTFTGKFRTSREFSGVTRGDSSHQDLEASYRIPLSPITWPGQECGHWYLRVGAEHERYDFRHRGGSLPLPDTLQSIAGVVAFEYLVKGEVAIFLEARPGAYFEHDIHCGTFNVPVKIGTAIPLSKTVYVTLGVAYNAF